MLCLLLAAVAAACGCRVHQHRAMQVVRRTEAALQYLAESDPETEAQIAEALTKLTLAGRLKPAAKKQ
jgi:hypothetical protein